MTKELIKIETTSDGKRAVSARELHKFLGVGRDFSNWIKDRIEKFDFVEDVDFSIRGCFNRTAREFSFISSIRSAQSNIISSLQPRVVIAAVPRCKPQGEERLLCY